MVIQSKLDLLAQTIIENTSAVASEELGKAFFKVLNEPETLPLFQPDPSQPSGPWIAAFELKKEAA